MRCVRHVDTFFEERTSKKLKHLIYCLKNMNGGLCCRNFPSKIIKEYRVGPTAVLFLMTLLGPTASAHYKDKRTSILLACPKDSDAENG